MPSLALPISLAVALTVAYGVIAQPPAPKESPAEWTMYGGTPSRNMVNLRDRMPKMPEKAPDWDDKEARKRWEAEWLLWKADLGSRCYAQPVVAVGKVFIGTNNERPRNKRDEKKNGDGEIEPLDKGVLMCFDSKSGKFLWQAVHDKLPGGWVSDWPREGLGSIPTVVGDRAYYVSNQCRVVCLDVNGLADGNQGMQTEKYKDATDADFIWEYDMLKELKVFPHKMSISCPLIIGDLLFVNTGNGVDEAHIALPSPDAPSFICLNRVTGKLVWQDNSPGKDVMHGQWASPAYAAEPVPQVIFPGGDGWLRAFDPPTGKLLWKFDCNPKDAKYELGGTGRKCDFIASPVIAEGRLYIGTGQDPEHFTGPADLWCVDLKKAVEGGKVSPGHDVSPDLLVKQDVQPKGKVLTKPNPASAVAWNYSGEENRKFAPRDFKFGRTLSTLSVVDGVVYAAELVGYLHCLDAITGKHYWQYDLKSNVWGSLYFVDGKIIVPTEDGDLFFFRHEKKHEVLDEIAAGVLEPNQKLARAAMKKVRQDVEKKYLIARIEMDAPIRGTPSVADGVFYLATEKTLYAFGKR